MNKTLTGVYASEAEAESAKQALSAENIDLENIRTVTPQDLEANSSADDDETLGEKVSDFISSFFDSTDTDELRESHRQAVRNGSTLVIVEPDTDLDAQRATRILGSHLSPGSTAAAADATTRDSSAEAADDAIGKPH